MFRLRRLYFDSIGVPENRFSDLMVDLTDVAGNPTDAIVWLRNGAGKTTMLSLLLALILPARRDFLATRTKKRTLEDLVQSGDTAHVVAEWVDPLGQLLLTGAVYEWDNRTRPRDYNGQGKERLRRSWWCLHPDPMIDGSTLDDLPFTLRSHGRYDRERFRAHVSNLATQGVNAVVADQTITEWHAALRERRFDPELFHYFTEVNAAEGGIDGLFAGIDSPGAFVRYLLRFVGDRQRIAPVRELLSDTAAEIAKRPVYLAEREFCVQAGPKVTALGEAHQAVLEANRLRTEVLIRAAGYKRALSDAEKTATTRRDQEKEQVEKLDAELTTDRATVEAARRRRAEYLRIAAAFRLKSAEESLATAELAAADAKLDTESWGAVDDHLRLESEQAKLTQRKTALRTASEEAKPLVDQVETAKAILAGALENEIDRATLAVTGKRAELSAATRERSGARADRDKARDRLAELDAEVTNLHEAIARFERDRQRLVSQGFVREDEQLATAEFRLRDDVATTREQIDVLDSERLDLEGQIGAGERQLSSERVAVAKAGQKHQALAAELERLSNRLTALADNVRLRDLMQSETVDLAHGADDALGALTRAMSDADLELIALREVLAKGERALRALETTELLPPRTDVETVLKKLDEAGITAHSGWRYLAKNIAIEDHARCIEELPEVVDGVVVYGDPAMAAARLTEPTDEVVVVSPATVFGDRRTPRVVLGLSAAHHDPAEAKVELERRRARQEHDEQRTANLIELRNADALLQAEISAVIKELPEDGMAGLTSRVAKAEVELSQAQERETATTDELKRLRNRMTEVTAAIGRLHSQLAKVTTALPHVTALVTTEQDVVEPAKTRLNAIPAEQKRHRELRAGAEERERIADETIRTLDGQIRSLEDRAKGWKSRRDSLPRPAEPTELPLEAADAAVLEAERQLREQFQEAELRLAVEEAEAAVQAVAHTWNDHQDEVKNRAVALARSSDGADRGLRVDAVTRARQRGEMANQAVGAAKAELEAAQRERDDVPQTRLRATDVVVQPTDRADAQRLAEQEEQEAVVGQQEIGQKERDRGIAEQAAARADTRAGMLRDQATLLRHVDTADEPLGMVPEDDTGARAAVRRLVEELDEARGKYETTDRARAKQVDELRRWASQDRFASVAEDEHGQAVHRLREMFRGESVIERVAAIADDLAVDLDVREKAIGQQLDQVETHKNNVVVRMTDLVEDALSLLNRASTLSELPEGIGPWEHRPFLVVEAKSRPSREQIGLRVGDLIDLMVRSGKIELDAVELLWRATEASVAEGFRATVLKPAPDQPTGRTPVEDMRKWSGGENLTASLVLFCVLARLRAEQRTGAKAGSVGGLVPLDNPVGKANYLPFLDLQRRVAQANGVQLVFWTGIGDLGAVTTFPRIAAMHKRPSATRPGRAYVQIDSDNSQVLDIVSAVRRDT